MGEGFRALLVDPIIIHDQAERHVGGNHLPGRARVEQRTLQPLHLVRPKEIGVGSVSGLLVCVVGPAVAALVQDEDVEMRTVAERAVDPARLDDAFAHRIHLVEGAGGTRREKRDVAFLVGGRQVLGQ